MGKSQYFGVLLPGNIKYLIFDAFYFYDERFCFWERKLDDVKCGRMSDKKG